MIAIIRAIYLSILKSYQWKLHIGVFDNRLIISIAILHWDNPRERKRERDDKSIRIIIKNVYPLDITAYFTDKKWLQRDFSSDECIDELWKLVQC